MIDSETQAQVNPPTAPTPTTNSVHEKPISLHTWFPLAINHREGIIEAANYFETLSNILNTRRDSLLPNLVSHELEALNCILNWIDNGYDTLCVANALYTRTGEFFGLPTSRYAATESPLYCPDLYSIFSGEDRGERAIRRFIRKLQNLELLSALAVVLHMRSEYPYNLPNQEANRLNWFD